MQEQSIQTIKNDPETAKTQLVIVTGFLVLWLIFKLIYFLYAATVIGVISLAIPTAGAFIVWGWYKLAEWLGWFNSRVLLSLVFYLMITPIGFFFRLFGNDPLLLKKSRGSMFHFREHTYKKEDLENPW